MKKELFRFLIILSLFFSNFQFAQQEKGITGYSNWLDGWTDFKPATTSYGEPTQILSGEISEDMQLNKKDVYLLLGDVFVTDSATITIEPGTVIKGDFKTKGSLIITNGSKIIADGTETDPIIFTSSKAVKKPGDWGGLFILGNAPINTFGKTAALNNGLTPSSNELISYGGDDDINNSGKLKFVRIEFAGKRTKNYGYFNGLTLAGVGSKTLFQNVMVSYCEGNAVKVIGGNVILEQMVSYKATKNDYMFNSGATATISNSIAVRSPYVSSPEGSRCLYVSSTHKDEEVDLSRRQTDVIAENLTLFNLSSDLKNDINLGLVKEAIFVDAETSFSINRSVISGFNPAVILDEAIELNDTNLSKIKFTSTYFNNCRGNIFIANQANNDDLESWYGSRAFNNVYAKGNDSETFIAAHHRRQPDFRLKINKIYAANDND